MKGEVGLFGSVTGLVGGERIRAVRPVRETMVGKVSEERERERFCV